MSIAPPSDIILDVAQAADPQKLRAATSKLAGMAAGVASGDFAATLAGAAEARPAAKGLGASTLRPTLASTLQPPASPYRKFEAVLLQTFVQEMLPKGEHLFGDAASADICRSMLAEQLATQLSKSDRFGIAKLIEKAHGPAATGAATHAPTAGAPAAAAPTESG